MHQNHWQTQTSPSPFIRVGGIPWLYFPKKGGHQNRSPEVQRTPTPVFLGGPEDQKQLHPARTPRKTFTKDLDTFPSLTNFRHWFRPSDRYKTVFAPLTLSPLALESPRHRSLFLCPPCRPPIYPTAGNLHTGQMAFCRSHGSIHCGGVIEPCPDEGGETSKTSVKDGVGGGRAWLRVIQTLVRRAMCLEW